MKRPLALTLLLGLALTLHAQHTLELGIHGGMAAWNGSCTYVSMRPDAHAGLHFAYGWYSPYVVGFRIGLSADMHRAGWSKIGYTDSYTTIDVENETMQIDYSIGSLTEIHTVWSAAIPVQIAWKWDNIAFLLGPKVVFPLACTWQENARNAELSVYYPAYDNRVYESYPLAASRSFEMQGSGKTAMPEIQWWLSAELSYDIPFTSYRTDKSGLSVGIYADYSFSHTATSKDNMQQSLIMLTDTRDGFPLSRILSSVVSSQRQGEPLVSRYNLFDVGIKLSWFFTPDGSYRSSRNDSRPSRHAPRPSGNTPCRCNPWN